MAVLELERVEVLVAEGMSTSAALTNRDAAMSTGLTPVASVYAFMKPVWLSASRRPLESLAPAIASELSRLSTMFCAAFCCPAATLSMLPPCDTSGGITILIDVEASSAVRRRGPPRHGMPPARTSLNHTALPGPSWRKFETTSIPRMRCPTNRASKRLPRELFLPPVLLVVLRRPRRERAPPPDLARKASQLPPPRLPGSVSLR